MRLSLRLTCCAVLALLILSADMALPAEVDDAALPYVSDDGYVPVDAGNLAEALGKTLGGDAMLRADADISAIEKAFLLVDREEAPLPRLRYVLRYGQRTIGGVEVSFVDVERYNLGPIIRRSAIEEYGTENVGDPALFGVGPHVAWRFVMQPGTKAAAMLLRAGRQEFTEEEASARNCLPRPCLSLEPLDGLASWRERSAPKIEGLDPTYPSILKTSLPGADDAEELAPARQALDLAVAAGIATFNAEDISWRIPERAGPDSQSPFIVVLIDRNLGQEVLSDAALGIAKLDKETEERWVRLGVGVFGGDVQRTFAEADGPLKP